MNCCGIVKNITHLIYPDEHYSVINRKKMHSCGIVGNVTVLNKLLSMNVLSFIKKKQNTMF